MEFRLARLAPGELDHEVLWASVGTLAAVVAWAWLSLLGAPPVLCPFHALTAGIPCPTCGGTRALMALVEGDIGRSLRYHPAVAPGIALGAVAWAYAWIVVAFKLPRIRVTASGRAATALRWGAVAAAAGVWATQIVRGI